jgi:hypothetical protein
MWLTVVLIVLGAACGLLGASAILSYLYKQRIATVRDELALERESKVKHAERLEVALAKDIAEGKRATGELVDTWQSRRAELLACGKAQPWAWDEEDLARWVKERATSQIEAIKRRTLAALALITIGLIALAGGTCALYYSHSASPQQPVLGATPFADDLAPLGTTPPADTTAAPVPTSSTPAQSPGAATPALPGQSASSPNPQPTKQNQEVVR